MKKLRSFSRFLILSLLVAAIGGRATKPKPPVSTGPPDAAPNSIQAEATGLAPAGDATNLPETISWDGKNDAGALAAEGSYMAALVVDYGYAFKKSSASSKSFLLDIKPPTPTFSPNPAKFAYSLDGVTKPISTAVSVKAGLAKVVAWTIDVDDGTREHK
jgi:hypothetical protein